jgi:ankyrin repeat protein
MISNQSVEDNNKKLLQAIENNDIQKVREILAAGVDVNSIADYDELPLKTACWHGNIEIVELLIENGVNVKRLQTFLILAGVSVGGLGSGWLVVAGLRLIRLVPPGLF